MKISLSSQTQRCLIIAAVVIGLCGIVIRFLNISQSNFIFYDEGYYLNYNQKIVKMINDHRVGSFSEFVKAYYALIRFSLNTGKTLWFLVVDSRAFWGGMTDWAFPRVISALAGSLTLGAVYLFAKRFYQSNLVALLSVAFLAVLPSHVFYSRLALQEALSTLFFILGFYFYFFPKRFGPRTFISALFCVCVFFTNYRLIILPAFIALAEIARWLDSKEKTDVRKFVWHTVTYFFLIFLIGSIDEGQNTVITFSWMFHQADLAKGKFDFFNVFSYPYYIFKLENLLFGLFFFANIFYVIRKEWTKAFPFLLVISMILLFSLVGERAARYLCVGLPFIVMGAASLIIYLLSRIEDRNFRIGIVIATAFMFLTLIPKAYAIAKAKTGYRSVILYLTEKDPKARILSTQPWVQNLFVKGQDDVIEVPHDFARLLELYAKGYNYLVIGPQAYVSFTDSQVKFDPPLKNYLGFVTAQIKPVMVFPHFNDVILERFVLEHNEDLRTSIAFLKTKDQGYGLLKVYDVKTCIAVIMSRLSPEQVEAFKQTSQKKNGIIR